MPMFIKNDARPESLALIGTPEILPRNCQLAPYKKLKNIASFSIKGEFIGYASPDSTYAVTRRLFDQAKKEIIIGIYDFSADYMKQLVLDAMQRGVKVSLMLDVDSKAEMDLFEELKRFGCNAVEAPSCASKTVHYFPSSHEKVIVIDGLWTLVQSGNFSPNSIPFNEKDGGDPAHFRKGNRDMGVAIKSKPLAEFFIKLLKRDMKLETDAEKLQALGAFVPTAVPELVEAVPKLLPSKLFPSKSFNPDKAISVTPVLTPDNYMDIVPAFIESARSSICIENQYIRSAQPDIARLLQSIKNARKKNPDLEVRIILGKLFGAADFEKEKINVANLKKQFELVLGKNIRYINTDRFVHCHNKLVIVDESRVLVSSQNWSNTGVASNREAGLLINYPQLAKYYTAIFESDWSTAFEKIPKPGKTVITPEALTKGNFVKVSAADYEAV